MSKFIHEKTISNPYIINKYYRAPEMILGKIDYNEKIDIFAAGCIISELFTLARLFQEPIRGLPIF